ncbi:MAG: putative pyrophosphohydrolase [Chitinophagaceae bacterium]|nr:putative pyrophosphohydrolase [Chitinophagaceae bacterium]
MIGFFNFVCMKTKQSAGILLYHFNNKELEVFLVHPGGPFWAKKDLGAWSIPKGEYEVGEDPLTVAKREFEEETSVKFSGNIQWELSSVKMKSGKIIYAWAAEGDIDPSIIVSNTFEMEWPPKSGKFQSIPEVDKGGWFAVEEAKEKINTAQAAFIDELVSRLKIAGQ